jgi:hypothetical protein
MSALASDSITLTVSDTTAPSSPSVSIDSGASSTTSTSVTLALSATDNVGVTGYYASETSTTPSASATGWTSVTSTTSYSANVSFTLSTGSGTKTVYVWFRDAAGNTSTSSNSSITLQTSSEVLELEPNNSFSTANLMNADTYYIGENSGSESYDYLKITATNNTMTVSLTHVTQNAGGSDFTVYIYYSDQSTKVGYFDANDGVNNSKTIAVTSGQTYYVRVYVYYSQAGYQYKLKASFSEGNVVNGVLELEPNNSFSTANLMNADTYYIGENSGSESYDYLKITATNNTMTVSLTHVTQNAGGSDFTVYIYYSDQSTKVGYFDANDGVNNSKTIAVTSGQTYYVRVYVGNATTYQYKLRVSFG